MSWEYQAGKTVVGPLSLDELKRAYHDGTITALTRVREAGSSIWTALERSDPGYALGIYKEVVYNDEGQIVDVQPDQVKKLNWRFGALVVPTVIYLITFAVTFVMSVYVSVAGFTDAVSQVPELVWTAFQASMIVSGLTFVASAIFYSLFFGQAIKNLRHLGAQNVTMTPAGVWGWFFVPIAGLFMPAKAMSQIWEGTHAKLGLETKHNWVLGTCWLTWLMGGFISWIFGVLDRLGAASIDFGWIFMIDAVQRVFFLVAGVLVIFIALKIKNLHNTFGNPDVADVFS